MKYDTTKQMWFEPMQFPDEYGVGKGYVFSPGFTAPPGGEIGSDTHALNDHTYCCAIGGVCDAAGEPEAKDAAKCLSFHQRRLEMRTSDADKLGIPFIVTEMGACISEAGCTQELTQVTQTADSVLAGWAYWQFKTYEDFTTSAGEASEGFYEKNGDLISYKVKLLSRPYMMYTQGVLSNMQYTDETGDFTATWTINDASASNMAFLNEEFHYPNSFTYSVSVDGTPVDTSALGATYTENRLEFDLSSVAAIGSTATLTVAKK